MYFGEDGKKGGGDFFYYCLTESYIYLTGFLKEGSGKMGCGFGCFDVGLCFNFGLFRTWTRLRIYRL